MSQTVHPWIWTCSLAYDDPQISKRWAVWLRETAGHLSCSCLDKRHHEESNVWPYTRYHQLVNSFMYIKKYFYVHIGNWRTHARTDRRTVRSANTKALTLINNLIELALFANSQKISNSSRSREQYDTPPPSECMQTSLFTRRTHLLGYKRPIVST